MRRKDREIRSLSEIREILDRADIVHLGLTDGLQPYVVAMHYAYRLEDGRLSLYLHCAREGRKLDLIRRNPRVCVEIDTGAELLSGGDEACRYGALYASVMGGGRAVIVQDRAEKRLALALLMKKQTGRDFSIPAPAVDGVCVLRLDIDEFSAKARRNNL